MMMAAGFLVRWWASFNAMVGAGGGDDEGTFLLPKYDEEGFEPGL